MPVTITVIIKVKISITSSNLMSLTAKSSPANIGDTRYLALPAKLTMPLALEYSSFVKISVTVALYEGSNKAEKIELIDTPIHICSKEACPLSIHSKIYRTPIPEKPSPTIISILLS